MTIKELNKANPGSYIMVTREFDEPLYIAPMENLEIVVGVNIEEAQRWSYADTLSAIKLRMHKAATGYNELKWEKVA